MSIFAKHLETGLFVVDDKGLNVVVLEPCMNKAALNPGLAMDLFNPGQERVSHVEVKEVSGNVDKGSHVRLNLPDAEGKDEVG